jgi:membrane protein
MGTAHASVWRNVARRIKRELKDGRASIMAAGVAFYCFLALFPALTALVSLYGLVADPGDVGDQMDTVAPLLPRQVRDVMRRELTSIVARSTGTLSLEVAVSILLALWAANKGTRALLVAVDVIFDPRSAGNIVKLSFVALCLTVGAVGFGVVSLGAVIAVPAVLGRLGVGSPGLRLLVWLRWPVLAAALLLGLALIYRFSRVVPRPRWRWVTPGSALAAALWLLGSALFSWFVSAHTSFQSLDGSIATFAVLLSWFLLSAYVVILGAAVDAEVEATPRQP